MFVNLNEITLPVNASSTPTAYAVPNTYAPRVRILNTCGSTVVVKPETSSTVTLTAPVAGTRFNGTAIADGAVEMFEIDEPITHISVYSATGTGLVYIQTCYGE